MRPVIGTEMCECTAHRLGKQGIAERNKQAHNLATENAGLVALTVTTLPSPDTLAHRISSRNLTEASRRREREDRG